MSPLENVEFAHAGWYSTLPHVSHFDFECATRHRIWHRYRHETLARSSTWVAEKIYRNLEIIPQIEKNSHVSAT